MKHILIYGYALSNFGGIEAIILSIISKLGKDCEFDFLIPKNDARTYLNRIEELGINYNIIYVAPYQLTDIFSFKTDMKKVLINKKYDFVWIHTMQAINFVIVPLIKRYSSAKIIIHSHNTFYKNSRFIMFILGTLLHFFVRMTYKKNADYYWGCSQGALDWMFGKKFKKGVVINNGIEIDRFKFNEDIRQEYRKKMGLDNKLVLLNIGRLVEEKNQNFLIDVFYEVQKVKKDSVLLLIGEGALKDRLQKKVEDLGLNNDQVLFLGYRKDSQNFLFASDIFCLPSLYEGFPVVLVESQTAGLPCLISDTVTTDCDINHMCKFLPIDKGVDIWVQSILSIETFDRNNSFKQVIKKGYDIKDVACKVKTTLGI